MEKFETKWYSAIREFEFIVEFAFDISNSDPDVYGPFTLKENDLIKAVITVPSNFNDLQREIIKKNYINAGFNVLRIINEPSAAALAYGLSISGSDEEKILVLDLGGGTFDITLLLKDNGFFEVIHSVGLNDLGGNDFTQIIYDFILKQYPNINDLNKLWFACQNAKEKLCYRIDLACDSKLINFYKSLGFNKQLICMSMLIEENFK